MSDGPTSSLILRELDGLGRPVDVGWVSGSALNAAVQCPSSAVLWRVLGASSGASRIGSALHDHIRQRNLYGVASALEMLPELAVRHDLREDETELFFARARAYEWSPPRHAVAELPLCLFEDGRVEVVKGGKGEYNDLPPDALIPAQIDLFWAEPKPLVRAPDGRIFCPPESVLWVIDMKTGREVHVEDAARNAQVLASAVLAAKFTGATKVIPGIVFMRKGRGIWDLPDDGAGGLRYFTAEDLAQVEKILTGAVYDVRRMRDAQRRGLPLIYRQGPHCNFCGARHTCPAHLATLKSWMGDGNAIEPGALDDDQLRQLAELAPSIRAFAESVTRALEVHVQATGQPIKMSDGRLYGPHATTRTAYDPKAAVDALVPEVGETLAQSVVLSTKVSEAGIKRAIKAAHDAKNISKQVPSTWRRVFGRMSRAGGVKRVQTVQWGFHKPKHDPAKDAETAREERLAAIAAMNGLPSEGDTDDEDD